MHKITHNMYNLFAEKLLEEISTSDYFSGVISFTNEDVEYELFVSLIIYHDHKRAFNRDISSIIKIADVWWELITTTTTGGKFLNDFNFNTLKKLIIQCQ